MRIVTRRPSVGSAIVGLAVATSGVVGQSVCEAPGTLRESLRIGSLDGDDALSGILDIAVGPNGDIFLAQQFTPSLAVFTAEGRLKSRIGRAGSGPGEFDLSPISVGWIRDTLWVTDLSSTQFFSSDGAAARQSEWRIPVPEEGSMLIPGSPLADGTFLARRVVTTAGGGDMADAFGSARHAIARISDAGELVDTIALARPKVSVAIESPWGGTGFAQHPLAGAWRGFNEFATTPDGTTILLPGDVNTDTGTFEVLRIGVAGDTLLKLTIPYVPKPISGGDRRWLTQEFGKVLAGEYLSEGSGAFSRSAAMRERDRRAAEASITFPDYYPPIRQIIGGEDGSIWILRELNPPALDDRWEVYSGDGARVGTIVISEGRSGALPWEPRLGVRWATMTELWGSTLGDFDEPYVHRYDISWACR